MNILGFLPKLFGSRNDRLIKKYRKIVGQINAMEAAVAAKTDAQLRDRTQEIRAQIVAGKITLDSVLPEALAIVRESMDRHIGIRNIFNPDEKFNPDDFDDAQFSDEAYDAYDAVQRRLIQTGESWQSVEIPHIIYAQIRKLYPESRPPFRARCFDVQIIGGLVLYEGKIAEMRTGEGKTFVAPLACFLRVLQGMHAHVVTVNDYLVRRDATWTLPAFANLGLSVGFIQSDMDPGGDTRKRAYQCDVTYGTNSEFGFDYLRDNMKSRLEEQVQGRLDYAIIDEVDSILIDEARTPLIISGAAHDNAVKQRAADEVARKVLDLHRPFAAIEKRVNQAKRDIKAAQGDLDKATDKAAKEAANARVAAVTKELEEAEKSKTGVTAYYETELDKKSVHLSHEGIAAAQEFAGVGSFYVGDNVDWPHLMEQALRAHVIYERDRDYVVEMNPQTGKMEVVIVDEYTGRKMTGRQWSDGLHQAVEAKERVPIKQESQTMATITLQNFFKLYKKIGGMTGTAATEAEEFNKIYKLEVVAIPTNRPVVRLDRQDRVYRTAQEKWEAIIEEIKKYHEVGRPVLVGTTSVEKSEMLSKLLTRKYGIKHEVLNARMHEREAHIVALAGQQHVNPHGELVGNVTIATNMAGRGTDIKPAPDSFFEFIELKDKTAQLKQRATGKMVSVNTEEERAEVLQLDTGKPIKSAGGLHVIGTERHTSRRIDNQLRGRSGRQGDAGSSRFYASLEDDLLKLFMPEWSVNVFRKIGMQYGEAIESPMLTKGIERAQKKVEERHYLQRKQLLEYDEVNEHQRNGFYTLRQRVLEGRDIDQVIWEMIGQSIDDAVKKYIDEDYAAVCIAEWSRVSFETTLEATDFKGMRSMQDLEDLIKGSAKNEVMISLNQTINEYLGEDRSDNSQWHVKDLSRWAKTKFGVELSESQLRKMPVDVLEETLRDAAIEQVSSKDVSELQKYIAPDFAAHELCQWAYDKFDVQLTPGDIIADPTRHIPKPREQIISMIDAAARKAYRQREVEYPVDQILTMCFGAGSTIAQNTDGVHYFRGWVKSKYNLDIAHEDVINQPLESLRQRFFKVQEQALTSENLKKEVDAIVGQDAKPEAIALRWQDRFGMKVDPKMFDPKTSATLKGTSEADQDGDNQLTPRDIVQRRVRGVYRHELTALEQYVLLQIFDSSWKDHLYAMDMLRGGIGLQAFAEKDPRIAFKREGFRFYEEMMAGIRDRVTGIIFRVYVQGEVKQKSAYSRTKEQFTTTENYDVGSDARAGEPGSASHSSQSAAGSKQSGRQGPKARR
jgi:preprotein translocase subunit SecA